MLKFSSEQAIALQQAMAPLPPILVAPPSMQPSVSISSPLLTTTAAAVASAAGPHQNSAHQDLLCCCNLHSMELTRWLLLGAYLSFALALSLHVLLFDQQTLSIFCVVISPVLTLGIASHAVLAAPTPAPGSLLLGLVCALSTPGVLLAQWLPVTCGYCVVLGLFLALTSIKGWAKGLLWACFICGLCLMSALLFAGVRGRTLWGPVITLLCIQATISLWSKTPLRLFAHPSDR